VLALLDEAKLTKQTAALRREIARAVEVARKRTSAEAKRVAASGAQDLASLSLRELRELAYNLGESNSREDQARAARAWLLAAAQEKEPFDRNDCLGRAALNFADAGRGRGSSTSSRSGGFRGLDRRARVVSLARRDDRGGNRRRADATRSARTSAPTTGVPRSGSPAREARNPTSTTADDVRGKRPNRGALETA
jgi:hypothetical protein